MRLNHYDTESLAHAMAGVILNSYGRGMPPGVTEDDIASIGTTLLLRSGRSLAELTCFSSVLLPGPVPRDLGLPAPDQLSWLLSAEVVTFCPVPDAGWQAASHPVLKKYASQWQTTLTAMRKSCRQDRLLHVPFAGVLGTAAPETWIHLEQRTLPGLHESFSDVTDAAPEIWLLRRPFITWPVDARQPRRFSRADRFMTDGVPNRFTRLQERILAGTEQLTDMWDRIWRRAPRNMRPELDYAALKKYTKETT